MMQAIQVKFKRLVPEAQVPKKANSSDSGFDLTAVSEPTVGSEGYLEYRTGIAIELPEGYEGQIRPRSSISKYDLVLANGGPGTIDASFRGEIRIRFKPVDRITNYDLPSDNAKKDIYKNIVSDLTIYKKDDRIAQLVIVPIPQIELIEAESLSETARGAGGFGSTGC